MKTIAIIADDLTGANDTAIQFCKYGLRTTVLIDTHHLPNLKEYRRQEIIAVNTATRALKASEAYERVYWVTQHLLAAGIKRFYKKIDSTLRGHPGAELEAVMVALKAKLAVVVPAFPANNRAQIKGYLVVSPLLATVQSAKKYHVLAVLKSEINKTVTLIDYRTVRQGPEALARTLTSYYTQEGQVLVIDAATENDLSYIAQACSALPEDVLIAGAAGLAAHLPLLWSTVPDPAKDYESRGLTIVVIGSRSSTATLQLDHLMAVKRTAVVRVSADEILTGNEEKEIQRCTLQAHSYLAKKTQPHLLLITVDTVLKPYQLDTASASEISRSNPADNEAIAGALGAISVNVLTRYGADSLIVGGGDTAYHVCLALQAHRINLITELLPGIPLGRLIGGIGDGLLIVTKAGSFGAPDLFEQILELLNNHYG